MTASRQRLGRRAEAIVARELERRGWRIVARNARPADVLGELDIVALDGAELVIVEVKAGRVGAVHGPSPPSRWLARASGRSCERWRPPGPVSIAPSCRAFVA